MLGNVERTYAGVQPRQTLIWSGVTMRVLLFIKQDDSVWVPDTTRGAQRLEKLPPFRNDRPLASQARPTVGTSNGRVTRPLGNLFIVRSAVSLAATAIP